ncbi:MAG: polysaccharide pyruvyl transferase family protein [Bacteroidales bacterium]|jgi:hypothetical protein|nr:polysaccharide pyruvyl transferase family protein [Bacteroidales bacterium]
MRIGILTFHFAHNYGAVLQVYALQEFLKAQGHNVTIINYKQRYLSRIYAVFNLRRFKTRNPVILVKIIGIELLMLSRRLIRRFRFNKFISSCLNLSVPVNKKNIPQNFDLYILGSDQIWNYKITNGFDGVYFGDFRRNSASKLISYAASMELLSLSELQQEYIKTKLEQLDGISVRESSLAELLQPLTGKTIFTTLDPVFLIDSHQWDTITRRKIATKKYVLIYQVWHNKGSIRIAAIIASQLGAEIIEVPGNNISTWHVKKNHIQCMSPFDFVGLIRYASCVITTSFHGTALSIVFNRPFYAIKPDDRKNNRVTEILGKLELSGRYISGNDDPQFSGIDYTEINRRLAVLRNKSVSFIRDAMSFEPNNTVM